MHNSNWLESLDCIQNKAIVDLVNGLDVSRDHQKVFDNQNFLGRFVSGFSGKNQQRQGEINKSLTEGLESTLTWLTELTESVASSNLAIKQVNVRVDKLSQHLSSLAGDYLQTRSQLQALADVTSERLSSLEFDIANLRLEVKAKTQLDLVMSKWSTGSWGNLPIASRCFITLEELRWGSFGDFIRSCTQQEKQDYLLLLKNKIVEQLSNDLDVMVKDRVDANLWIKANSQDSLEAVSFLGNWCIEHKHPSTFFVTQEWEQAPIYMPRIISPSKLGSSLMDEVFIQEAA